jgi:pimeloyl-ACP methyl ester carboxylesterase
MSASQNLKDDWKNLPTRTITAGGVEFAYRELVTNNPGTPVVFSSTWLPSWTTGSSGCRWVRDEPSRDHVRQSRRWRVQRRTGTSIEQMAMDAITFIKPMGFEQVDLFGFSMGVMIAQEIVLMEPQLRT